MRRQRPREEPDVAREVGAGRAHRHDPGERSRGGVEAGRAGRLLHERDERRDRGLHADLLVRGGRTAPRPKDLACARDEGDVGLGVAHVDGDHGRSVARGGRLLRAHDDAVTTAGLRGCSTGVTDRIRAPVNVTK